MVAVDVEAEEVEEEDVVAWAEWEDKAAWEA